MSLSPTLLEKRVAWVRLYDWDFSQFDEFEAEGQSIATATVTVTQGDSALTVGSAAISGTRVQVELSAGTQGILYVLNCSITTSPGGFTLSQLGNLLVLP